MFAFGSVSAFKRTLRQSPSVTAPSAGSLGAECRIIYTSSVGFAATFPSGQRGRLGLSPPESKIVKLFIYIDKIPSMC